MNRRLLAGALVVGLAFTAGCPDNPYEADTWIDKLDDSREAERAVTELEHLGDPKAIPALGRAWDKQGKPVRVLQVIIDLAQPLTPKEAEEKFLTNFAKTGRPASWDKAMPVLKQAVTEIDSANPRSLDSAVKAADALGDAGTEQAEEILIELANDPEHKLDAKALRVRLSAIVALGKYKDERAISALSAMLKKSLDDYAQADEEGKAAKDDNAKKGAFERSRDAGIQAGAAINALAEMRSPAATPVLIEAMYRLPGLATQVRRALVASGAGVAPELKKILKGDHAEVNKLFAEKKLDKFCPPGAPATDCKPISAKDFYAALILGDLYDTSATPELLIALARPPLPVYYTAEGPSPNTQHNAIFDALRKIGAADAAGKAKAVWEDAKQPVVERALAVGAYGFLARDASAIPQLRDLVNNPATDAGLRQEMLTTIARVAQDAGDLVVFKNLAKLNREKYVEAKKKAEGKERDVYEAAKKALADAKKKFADAKAAFMKAGGARKAPAEVITAMTEAQKQVDAADEKHDDARADWKPLDDERRAFLDFTRGVELHIARVEIAIHCKKDAACYGKTLAVATSKNDAEKLKLADEIGGRLTKAGYISDWSEWTPDDKKLVIPAQAERAMLELGKLGQAAGDQLSVMLDAATTDDRIIRQSILLALPKVAKLPCKECEQKLAAAVKAGEGKSTLGELNVETMILRNYFSWAGGNKPDSVAP
jgi:hypothetical protein